MKNKFLIIPFIILLTLSSCNNVEEKEKETYKKFDGEYEFVEYEFNDDYDYDKSVDSYKHIEVPIINNSTKEFSKEELDLYYVDNKYIVYLEFENYINLMKDMFEEDVKVYVDEKNSAWKMEYVDFGLEEDEEESTVKNESIIFNFGDDTVTFSDINLFDSFFTSDEEAQKIIETFDRLYVDQDSKIISETKEIVFSLRDYDLEMINEDDAYIMPLHLLSFFLSSYDNKLLYNGETVTYDNVMIADKYPEAKDGDKVKYNKELVEFSSNVMKLIFENYYGLKDVNEDYMKNFGKTNSVKNHVDNVKDYLIALNDGHTSVITYLYGADGESYTDMEIVDFTEWYEGYQRVGCDFSEELKSYELSENTVVVQVDSFMDENFAEEYFSVIDSVRNYENIVLDIKCNSGGYALNSKVFLYPFTDEPIASYSGDITGGETMDEYIKLEERAIETLTTNNVYLVTSEYSFSAANYAAVLFSQNNIGKIIGEKSGGGTAAISIVTLPDGGIIVMSSGSYLIYDNNSTPVEQGASVDINLEFDAMDYKKDLLDIIEQ